MKKILLVCSIFLGSIIACVDETPLLFDVRISARLDIPSGLNTIETYYFIIKNVPTFFAQSAINARVDASTIKSIQSGRGLMKSTFVSEDLSYIDRISIYAISKSDPNKKREMYYLDFVPLSTDSEIKMLSATSEFKDIMQEELIDLEVRINVRDFNPKNISCTLDLGYSVL